MAVDMQTEAAEVSPKTEAGRKLVQWAEGLEKWSKEKVSTAEAIGVLGGLAVVAAAEILLLNPIPEGSLYFKTIVKGDGFENGGFLDLARELVQNTSTIRVGEWGVGAGPAVRIDLTAEDRKLLVNELLDLEKFKSLKEGAATVFFLAGLGMAALTRIGEKESSVKHSTVVVPGVAKAMASLGKML